MGVQVSRRKICKLAAFLPIALPMYQLSHANEQGNPQSYVQIMNTLSEPVKGKKTLVLVDTDIVDFQGDGLYIYPNWGNPVVYEVTKDQSGILNFYCPEKSIKESNPNNDSPLWRVKPGKSYSGFSGKVTGYVSQEDAMYGQLQERLVELQVPARPS